MTTPRHDAHSLSIAVDGAPARTRIRLTGDFEPSHRLLFTEILRGALKTSAITELDLSRAGVFGSAAVAAIVDARRDVEQPTLVIRNPAPHIVTVLEISNLDIPVDTEDADEPGLPSSRPGYDQLIARSVTSGREAMCITTDELDSPGPEIVYVNPAFCALTGYSANEIIGQSPRVLQGALTDRVMLDRLRAQLEQRETFHGETVNYRKDGAPFFMNWKITAVDADDGRYFVAHQIDATTSVRATRNVAATALLRDAADHGEHERNQRLADALVAAHHMLLGAGSVGSEITAADTRRSGDTIDRSPAVYERARDSGPEIIESDLHAFELIVSADIDSREVRVVVTGLTSDHLKLTALDDHVGLVRLAASLAVG